MFHFIALYFVSILHNNMNLRATVQLLRHLLQKNKNLTPNGSSLP